MFQSLLSPLHWHMRVTLQPPGLTPGARGLVRKAAAPEAAALAPSASLCPPPTERTPGLNQAPAFILKFQGSGHHTIPYIESANEVDENCPSQPPWL